MQTNKQTRRTEKSLFRRVLFSDKRKALPYRSARMPLV